MEFWGSAYGNCRDYSSALRQFVRYTSTDEAIMTVIRRLAGEQSMKERQWHQGRESLMRARASETKLHEYDLHIYNEAIEWSKELRVKLTALGLTLFSDGSAEDQAKFLQFLSDIVAPGTK